MGWGDEKGTWWVEGGEGGEVGWMRVVKWVSAVVAIERQPINERIPVYDNKKTMGDR